MTVDRCNACGCDLVMSENHLVRCKHCDSDKHGCTKTALPCKLLAQWEGSGPHG